MNMVGECSGEEARDLPEDDAGLKSGGLVGSMRLMPIAEAGR